VREPGPRDGWTQQELDEDFLLFNGGEHRKQSLKWLSRVPASDRQIPAEREIKLGNCDRGLRERGRRRRHELKVWIAGPQQSLDKVAFTVGDPHLITKGPLPSGNLDREPWLRTEERASAAS